MPIFKKVNCAACKKSFYKDSRHVNENLKLGHKFYCSKICESKNKNRQKLLTCGNPDCNKSFFRQRNDILLYNYCSKSCAAIVNNQRYPKWPKRYCTVCNKEFKNRDSKYCSSKCGWLAFRNHHEPKYSQEQMVAMVKKYYQEHKRVPAKREISGLTNRAINLFGTWNKAIIVAGLEPNRSHDHRMYRRTMTKARDGHLCDSISEAIIDNWLTAQGIAHTRDVSYSGTNHKADWSLRKNTFVEYFGLAQDSPRYDRAVREKQKICHEKGIKLIEIYPRDLYPTFQLNEKKDLFTSAS